MNKSQFPASALIRLALGTLSTASSMLFRKETFRQWPRLLREGIDPAVHLLLQASNTTLVNLWLSRGSKVVLVSSYPRSGNTWMRYLLSDVLLQMHGLKTTTRLPIHPNDLMPEFAGHCVARRIRRCPPVNPLNPSAAFVKTHFLFERHRDIFVRNGSGPMGDGRILYLYRTPEDALVSYYHLCQKERSLRHNVPNGLDSFCRGQIAGWNNHLSSYLRAADNGIPVFLISYEKMLENPALTLGRFLHWLGVKHEEPVVNRAVSNMQFAKLQAMEMEQSQMELQANERNLFFRRGCTGSGRAELNEGLLQEIHAKTGEMLAEARRREAGQSGEPPAVNQMLRSVISSREQVRRRPPSDTEFVRCGR